MKTSAYATFVPSVSDDSYYHSLPIHCEPHLQTAPPLYDATEVIDLLDDMTDREEEEPCLEGSDDELGLRLSEDEERLVNTT